RLLAWYYILTDFLLIGQVYYYRTLAKSADKHNHDNTTRHIANDEESALLGNNNNTQQKTYNGVSAQNTSLSSTNNTDSNVSSPAPSFYNSGRRMSTASERIREILKRRRIRQVLMVLLPVSMILFFVYTLSGMYPGSPKYPPPGRGGDESAGSIESWSKGNGNKGKDEDNNPSEEWIGVALGWGSAILYLGSRLPQIYKNWKVQSCEGLSILMFVFSVLGNIFYVASIFFNSMDRDYLIRNMPWWIGSGGTLIFDFVIFGQFYIYRNNTPSTNIN
ncbi:hypothetical protein BGZ76_005585, partial [Entomortierella beljakovae]